MHKYVLTVVLSLLASTAFAEAPPGARRKVAIVDGIRFKTEGLRTTVPEATHFFKVLTEKLTEGGWSPIPPVSQVLCLASRDCLEYIARETGADYVLRITGDGNLMEGYSLHVEVYSPRTRHSQRTNNVCDVCLTNDIAHSTATLSLGLIAEAVKDDADTERERDQQSQVAHSAEGQPDRAMIAAASVPEPRHISWIPWSMVGVGVVGLGLGGWWLYQDGRSKELRPTSASPVISNDYYSSRSLGIASLFGGGIALAAGGLWLALTPSSTARVTASPGHVAFSLRY